MYVLSNPIPGMEKNAFGLNWQYSPISFGKFGHSTYSIEIDFPAAGIMLTAINLLDNPARIGEYIQVCIDKVQYTHEMKLHRHFETRLMVLSLSKDEFAELMHYYHLNASEATTYYLLSS